ncbi:MAG: hypothetical protein LBP92_14475 [Deltaproteobacteria bacterium]|jgi:hypothetical protein|nr:hypothetical protein [Deltaproteobacteria bacterium]
MDMETVKVEKKLDGPGLDDREPDRHPGAGGGDSSYDGSVKLIIDGECSLIRSIFKAGVGLDGIMSIRAKLLGGELRIRDVVRDAADDADGQGAGHRLAQVAAQLMRLAAWPAARPATSAGPPPSWPRRPHPGEIGSLPTLRITTPTS